MQFYCCFECSLNVTYLGTCSYRLESYWTYEVCHGKYIRQYHEEREGKKIKLQEYILGKWDEKHFDRLLEKDQKEREDLKEDSVIPTKKIENSNLPYFEVTWLICMVF